MGDRCGAPLLHGPCILRPGHPGTLHLGAPAERRRPSTTGMTATQHMLHMANAIHPPRRARFLGIGRRPQETATP